MSDYFRPHGLQHAGLLCALLSSKVCSNSCPLSQWCHPTVSSSATLFSFCLQSLLVLESFPVSRFFPSGGQTIGALASTSVLTMNTQTWFPVELTGLISLQSKGLSRVFSSTTFQKHQFFGPQPSLWPLPTKVHIVKAMVFPVVMYGWDWELEHMRVDLVDLEKNVQHENCKCKFCSRSYCGL